MNLVMILTLLWLLGRLEMHSFTAYFREAGKFFGHGLGYFCLHPFSCIPLLFFDLVCGLLIFNCIMLYVFCKSLLIRFGIR